MSRYQDKLDRGPSLQEWIASYNPGALLADGFEEAILGIAQRCGQPGLVVYDAGKCIQILIDRDGMEREDAVEFFEFNVLGSWLGPNTPLFLWPLTSSIG